MEKTKVALLFGGRSAEHEVSLSSAAAIYNHLDKRKLEVLSLFINKEGMWKVVDSPCVSHDSLNQGSFASFLPWSRSKENSFFSADVYFPVLHGPYGEDGTIQGLFDMADVPYVGAAVLASSLGMDKAISKALFQAKGLPVVKHLVIHETNWRKNKAETLDHLFQSFSFPVFTKPSCLGSSLGITKVKESKQIEEAVELAFGYDRKILVEEAIKGRELECSILGNENPRASLPGEIIPSQEFYNYQDKYIDGKTSFGIPARLPDSTIEEIQQISIKAFQAIDCSGMARADFFLQEKTEKIFLNEINTIPGFTEISMYPKLWEVSGLSFSQLLEQLIELAMERHRNRKRPH